jgi:hypothetical protein
MWHVTATAIQDQAPMSSQNFTPRAGDWVEVRPAAEILANLATNGESDGMPFMPEMLAFAGRRYQVSAVAHKTCDTVNRTGGRKVRDAVHLADLRCDGAAHGGCQAACLLFWKTQWLRPVPGPAVGTAAGSAASVSATDHDRLAAQASRRADDGVTVYRCQATTLPQWSQLLKWWDLRQYWRDVRCGNATARHALVTLFLGALYALRRYPGGYRPSVWFYGRAHRWLKGTPDPHGVGTIRLGEPTPDVRSDLRVGEIVEIRPRDEIYATVNVQNRNRGMQVDEEMTKFCGGRFRVASRVSQIVNEQTGRMMHFKNPCIVLDGVNCMGDYSHDRLLCPRRITAYWREIWLERIDEAPRAGPKEPSPPRA